MAWRFNPPPTWPAPPEGWVPPPGWAPDPSWPPAPEGWQFWVEVPGSAAYAGSQPGSPPPVPPAAPRRRGGPVRVLLVVVVVLVGLGLVAAAIGTVVSLTRRTQAQDLVTETTGAAVRVENPCGPIALRQGVAGSVSTRATIRYSWRTPTVSSRLEGDVVVVIVDCPVLALGSGVSLVVEVPPDGTVEARSSAGSVQADGLSSDLTLRSSAGAVSATALTSRMVSAESSAGSVSLVWAAGADPNEISARSSAGSVSVRVPDVEGVAYRVDADSSAGSTTVRVRTDEESTRTITARSSAGSVLVDYR